MTASSIAYLDLVSGTDPARAYKQHTLDLLQTRAGDAVLDIGCGAGDDVRALALRVGPSGRVVGVDSDPRMVAEAWRRASVTQLPVEFGLGDAHALDFADATFAGCRSDRVFQHLEDPDRALEEMIRVTRPGGRVVIADVDWETVAIDSADRRVVRQVVQFKADRGVRHGWIGRSLHGLFGRHGLEDVTVLAASMVQKELAVADRLWGLRDTLSQAREAGVLSADEADGWWGEMERAQAEGRFFGSVTGFVVSGRKGTATGDSSAGGRNGVGR